MKPITENIIEQSAIEMLQSQGWDYANGRELSPEGLFCERENYQQIILINRLRTAIAKINPHIPPDAQEAAVQKQTAQLVGVAVVVLLLAFGTVYILANHNNKAKKIPPIK